MDETVHSKWSDLISVENAPPFVCDHLKCVRTRSHANTHGYSLFRTTLPLLVIWRSNCTETMASLIWLKPSVKPDRVSIYSNLSLE